MTDTERINWLESQYGWGLISDDNGRFACVFEGIQNVPDEGKPFDLVSNFFIKKEHFKPTVREAIDGAMENE